MDKTMQMFVYHMHTETYHTHTLHKTHNKTMHARTHARTHARRHTQTHKRTHLSIIISKLYIQSIHSFNDSSHWLNRIAIDDRPELLTLIPGKPIFMYNPVYKETTVTIF